MDEIKPGSVWRNKDPYPGEGNIKIAGPARRPRYYECTHINHTRHPALNGSVELKHECAILSYYNKISE